MEDRVSFYFALKPLAVRAAAFIGVAAIVGISCPTLTLAAPQRNVARPAPRMAPRTARPAPQIHANRPAAPQFHPNGPAQNSHAVSPHIQHANPAGGRLNNQNFQHANPNLRRGNPTAGGGTAPGGIKFGPGQHIANTSMRHGPGASPQAKPAFPAVSVNNRFWPILKGPKFMWVGGARHFFVPVGLLGVAVIGSSYWYPDGYVSIAGPACYGFTPDGCQLEWRMVAFEDGGGEPQCVQYCPQSGPPPATAAPLPPPPALMQSGKCEVTIYADPNFAGLSSPTSDNQATLSQAGWQNEISSIQVQSGTWDFFSGENFDGESMRLTSGEYPTLAPQWTKRIGSFMCVAPGAPGA
jgi:hypothetical protein